MTAVPTACDAEAPPAKLDSSAASFAELSEPSLAPAQDEQTADVQGCEMPVPEQYLELEWLDVSRTDTVAVSLATASADLRITNARDQAVVVRLDVAGHRGTTRDVRSDLGTIEVGAHGSVDIAVDLGPYLEGDSPYSRSVVVGAFAEDPLTGGRLETAVGPGLYFHELPTGDIAAYNDRVLVDTYRGGDHDPHPRLAPAELRYRPGVQAGGRLLLHLHGEHQLPQRPGRRGLLHIHGPGFVSVR
jgi:hypothetical protein